MDSISFSATFDLRSRAFRKIHDITSQLDELTTELCDLDNAVRSIIDSNCVESQQDLANVVRRLAAILDGGQA